MAQGVVAVGSQVIDSSVTIAINTSLSNALDCTYGRLVRIVMPSAWTTANLTFQASYDGTNYSDLYDSSGTEYTVTAAASRAIVIPYADFVGIRFLKIRSGTTGVAVNQAAARTLTVLLLP